MTRKPPPQRALRWAESRDEGRCLQGEHRLESAKRPITAEWSELGTDNGNHATRCQTCPIAHIACFEADLPSRNPGGSI